LLNYILDFFVLSIIYQINNSKNKEKRRRIGATVVCLRRGNIIKLDYWKKNFIPIFVNWNKLFPITFIPILLNWNKLFPITFIPILLNWNKLFPNIIATLLQYFLNILFFCHNLAIVGI